MSCSSSSHGGFGAFLGGMVLGGIAALLLAPHKGEVTRRKIKVRLDNLRGALYLNESEVAELMSEPRPDDDEIPSDELGDNA